jgi:hypothetical protein
MVAETVATLYTTGSIVELFFVGKDVHLSVEVDPLMTSVVVEVMWGPMCGHRAAP